MKNLTKVALENHFSEMLSTPSSRTLDLRWEELDYGSHNMEGLDGPFSEQEVRNALALMPRDKAPGPDGFTFIFYRTCWSIIKADIMAVFQSFHSLRTTNLPLLNTASITLIPKK